MDRTAQEREDHILDCYEAIKQRDAEIERLRAVLKSISDECPNGGDPYSQECFQAIREIVEEALEEKK